MELDRRVFIVAVVLGLVVCLAAFGLYRSRMGKVTQVKTKIEEEKQKNDIAIQILTLSKKLEAAHERFSKERDTAWFLNELTVMANEAGVELAFIEPQAPFKRDDFVRLPVKLGFESSFSELGSLIERIETYETIAAIAVLKTTVDLQRPFKKEDEELYSKRFGHEPTGEWLKKPRTILVVSAFAFSEN